jgi:hypothetical protein
MEVSCYIHDPAALAPREIIAVQIEWAFLRKGEFVS